MLVAVVHDPHDLGDVVGHVQELDVLGRDESLRELLANGLVSPEDVELLHVTDDPAEAVQLVHDCYERRCATPSPAGPEKADAQ